MGSRFYKNYILLLRPQQWIKNVLVFAGLIFSENVGNVSKCLTVLASFIIFCAVSSGIYIINDIIDRNEDKRHPEKSNRPIASGKVSIPISVGISIVLLVLSFLGAGILSCGFFAVIFIYFVIHIVYSLFLKQLIIVDVFCIAAGFVLRAMGGAAVIQVEISPWLILCTFFVSLFIGFGKRRNELELLQEDARRHRPILGEYTPYFLDNIISVVTGATVLSYALYTVSPETVRKFGSINLLYTVPFVLYGIFRYLFLVHQKKKGGDPTKIFLSDRSLQVNIVLWIVLCFVIIYLK
ncbi:decaprenyl-phosphate phosphoribosyltransferase [Chlamydiota bacterium]